MRMARARSGAPVDPVEEPDDEPATDPWDYAEPIGPNPGPTDPAPAADPGTDPLDITPAPAAETDQTEALRGYLAARGSLMEPRVDPPDTQVQPATEPAPEPVPAPPAAEPDEQVTTAGHPGTPTPAKPARRAVVWPIVLLALPAFVAIWGGWVGLGGLTGFGKVNLLPGIVAPGGWATIDSAITLPVGVETYGAYALYIWLSGRVPGTARTFAKWSAIASLIVGALGQVAYHLLVAAGVTAAPWWITTLVACLPVAVLGMGAALAHLVREEH
ncbi:ABC transporter permease [Micromonospora sp. NPDC023644]|uniref:ABC transporter permease n=1 Tax=Micromonospora sp. NPDC023644 TaxID=3154321 RepID=UPI0033FD0B60